MLPEDPHDTALVGSVRPRDWKNPEPAERHDLVVLGGGTAGLVCAATVVGPRAGDLIGEATLAVTAGMKVSALSNPIHPDPTNVEVWRRLGDKAMRGRLTSTVKRLLAWWFRRLR